jgi:peptide chain release factor 1
VHTSSVTVSITNPELTINSTYSKISDNDFRVEWFSGTGSGGQHRNKKQTSCRVIHIPTNMIETAQTRSREQSFKIAKNSIINRLNKNFENSINDLQSNIKRSQIGSGMRGDKIRTYRFQDDYVIDHNSGKRVQCSKVMKGYFNLLWN